MTFFSNKALSDFLQADIADKKVDSRLSLSMKREFWASKFNSIIPAAISAAEDRRFHAYCIGSPRSGTHSIAHMLQQHYHTDHEPRAYYAIYHLLNWMSGKYSKAEIQDILKWRSKQLSLELEASHYLHHVADVLVNIFPAAKFILTVRDPLSWLESEINRNDGTQHNLFWRELENYRYGRYENAFTRHDTFLKEMGLYPIASYLSYWKDHNQFVLSSIPKERLLTLETRNISSKADEIAQFLDINANTINPVHSDKRKKKRFRLADLSDSSKAYLCQQLETICLELIDTQLPEANVDWYSLMDMRTATTRAIAA